MAGEKSCRVIGQVARAKTWTYSWEILLALRVLLEVTEPGVMAVAPKAHGRR
ncbi:MAG TPA: hypothetical protein VMV29_10165 [Ktedonobacterales bacterium]|nr:hypothetical protein [Ktedonobacterales bacterium]